MTGKSQRSIPVNANQSLQGSIQKHHFPILIEYQNTDRDFIQKWFQTDWRSEQVNYLAYG